MTKYTVWISCGDSPNHRCYFNELGAEALSEEQINKYFTFDEEDKIEFNSEVLCEASDKDWDEPDKDFPTWDTITEGSICWGPDADDQYIGVCLSEDEDENPIYLKLIHALPWLTSEELKENSEYLTENPEYAKISYELPLDESVQIVYNSYERGSYIGEFEISDDKEFDPSKLVVNISEVADSWNIVTGIEYDGEYVYCDSDTMGKGIDWHVYHKGNLYNFK